MKHVYRFALAAMLLVTFSMSAFSQPWTAATDFTGAGRSGAVSFTIGDYAYVGLGQDADNYYADFYKYDPSTDSWEQISDFPGAARADAVAFTVNGIAYVGTGFAYTPYPTVTYYNDFYAYNPATNTWSAISDFSGSARSAAVAFAIGDFGYVGTGIDASDETKDFYKYNPSTDTWSAIANLASDKRKGAVGFAINGKGYVSAGGYADFKKGSFQHSDVYSYDPATNSWTEEIFADGTNLPFQSASVFVVNAKAYICYGNQDHVAVYDPADNSVQNKGDAIGLGSNRYSGVAFSINNKGYYGTGSYTEWKWTTIYNTDLWQFAPPNPPTDITLSDAAIDENVSAGSLVGTLEATDADAGDSHTFSLVEAIDYDYADFSIEGNSLKIDIMPDYEYVNSYTLGIKVEDQTGLTYEEEFVVVVNNLNEEITGLDLSPGIVEENQAAGAEAGRFDVSDDDDDDEYTFTFVKEADNADSIYFHISDDKLIADSSFNYERKQSYAVMVKVEDTGGNIYEESLSVAVFNRNESPTALRLSENVIPEGATVGTELGSFSSEDTDASYTHRYRLESGDGTNDKDNDRFTIDGSQLVLDADIDPEEQTEYHIYVRVSDEGGLHYEKAFTLTAETSTSAIDDLDGMKIAAYPNPTSGKLYLELGTEVENGFTLTLFNSLGAVVKQQVVNQKKTLLQLEDVPSGVYFLQLEEAPACPVIRILKK